MKALAVNQRLFLLIFLVIALILNSCVLSDCWYDYEWKIENKTNSIIQIYYKSFNIYPEVDTTIFILQDSSKTILNDGNLEGCTGCKFKKNCGPYPEYGMGLIDSIYITMNDTMQAKFDYSDYKQWNFYTEGDIGIYQISLNANDFVKKQ